MPPKKKTERGEKFDFPKNTGGISSLQCAKKAKTRKILRSPIERSAKKSVATSVRSLTGKRTNQTLRAFAHRTLSESLANAERSIGVRKLKKIIGLLRPVSLIKSTNSK